MKLINTFELRSKGKSANIGIGLGTTKFHNQKILTACIDFLSGHSSKITIFGPEQAIQDLEKKEIPENFLQNINFIECEESEKDIIKSLQNNAVDAIIRGSLSSNKFLSYLRQLLNIQKTNRLALLETINGHQFFFGPVGIDECDSIRDKIEFIELTLLNFELLEIKPNISVLSGGRFGDIGRGDKIEESIKNSEKIVQLFKEKYPKLSINHHEILIENAIMNRSNFILAPNGVSGNLIYRTLVHLGGGKAYGAIYMGIEKVIIDTSRVGEPSEIIGALLLALSLV